MKENELERKRRLKREAKKRYFAKTYAEAEMVECACGCGIKIRNKDKYGRDKKYISGHNGRKYEIGYNPKDEYRKKPENKIMIYKKNKKNQTNRNRLFRHWLYLQYNAECNHCKLKYDGSNYAKFELHHIEKKDFEIHVNVLDKAKITKQMIIEEIPKCIMLCANCHKQWHREQKTKINYFDLEFPIKYHSEKSWFFLENLHDLNQKFKYYRKEEKNETNKN